ncbi:MAG: calcium-binding EGF-like domain-containing protein [Polyangiaceae bacterium]|nr:calcium-binding EGF-like domain-containing protein [Polyangiaceae bacterium]
MDDCAAGPCLNGGTCTDGIASYTCKCKVGYNGTHCETNIDDCAADPCLHGGTCSDGVGTLLLAMVPSWPLTMEESPRRCPFPSRGLRKLTSHAASSVQHEFPRRTGESLRRRFVRFPFVHPPLPNSCRSA